MKKRLIVSVSLLLIFVFVSAASASQQWVQYSKSKWQLLDDTALNIKTWDNKTYIGTQSGGITVIEDESTSHITAALNGMSSNFVRSFDLDKSGQIAVGTATGLNLRDKNGVWHRFNKTNSSILGNEITAVAFDKKGGIWAGIKHLGLSHRDKDGKWTSYSAFNTGLPSNDIKHIAVDNNGGLWVATYPLLVIGQTPVNQQGGIGYMDPDGTWTSYNLQNSAIPSSKANAVAIDHKGGKWFATHGGTAYLSADGNWKVYTENNSRLPENVVKHIAVDTNNNPWFATWGGGLAHIDASGKWHILTKYNSLLGNNYLHTVTVDTEDNIWIGTNIGVFKYSPNIIQQELVLNKDKVEVVFNNMLIDFDVEPFIDNGTTFVPLRRLADELGMSIRWVDETRKVFLTNQNVNIELTIGQLDVYRNGQHSKLLAHPRIINDRTMVPARFISESIGIDVIWDGDTKTVYINK